jgi:flagellar biosynthetic protein FliR
MVLTRFSVLFALVPLFGDQVIPPPVKVLLALSFSAVMFPMLRETGAIQIADASIWSASAGKLLLTVFAEVLIGLSIGFASQLVFHAIHVAGELLSTFMGLSMSTQYDPHAQSQSMVISQILGTLGMLTFLAMDGHHVLLQAMLESFRLIPVGHFPDSAVFQQNLLRMIGNVLSFGVQLSAPMSACMLLVNIVYGVLGKALPQLNILTLSMASGIFIGGVVLLISYPSMQAGMNGLFMTEFEDLKQLMVAYGGK